MTRIHPTPRDVDPPCTASPDLMFVEAEPGVSKAKAVCEGCPLRTPCAAYAMAHDVEGVWAATTTKERQRLRRKAGIKAKRLPVGDFGQRRPVSHGTPAGAAWHRSRYQPLCEPCQASEDDRNARRRERRVAS